MGVRRAIDYGKIAIAARIRQRKPRLDGGVPAPLTCEIDYASSVAGCADGT
jgi:hypothetical protein